MNKYRFVFDRVCPESEVHYPLSWIHPKRRIEVVRIVR